MSFFAAFVAGMNFYSLLNFFPMTYETVYTPTPLKVGIYGLGYGFSVAGGASFFNFMMSVFRNHNREILIFCAVLMSKSQRVSDIDSTDNQLSYFWRIIGHSEP